MYVYVYIYIMYTVKMYKYVNMYRTDFFNINVVLVFIVKM